MEKSMMTTMIWLSGRLSRRLLAFSFSGAKTKKGVGGWAKTTASREIRGNEMERKKKKEKKPPWSKRGEEGRKEGRSRGMGRVQSIHRRIRMKLRRKKGRAIELKKKMEREKRTHDCRSCRGTGCGRLGRSLFRFENRGRRQV
jgi:hypothetical protein